MNQRSADPIPRAHNCRRCAAAAWPAQDGLRKHYQYDTAGELRQRAHSQQGATRYDYDPIGRLLGAERNNGHTQAERFAYDPAGNLLDKPPAKGSTRGYVRDNLVRVFEDKRYDYDGHGRLAEKRSGKHTVQRFEWDDEHRLSAVHTTRISPMAKARPGKGAKADGAASATAHTTQTTRFEYDALGRRIAKTDAFGRTEFIWEGMRLIEERRGFHATAYVYEPGSYVPLARIDAVGHITEAGGLGTTQDAPTPANDATQGVAAGDAQSESGNESTAEPSSNLYYFHVDQVGLPEELTDPQGHIRWRAAYQALGQHPGRTLGDGRPQGRGGGLRRRRRATGDRTEPAVPGPVPGPRYRAALQHLPLLRSGYRAVHLAGSHRPERWHQPVRVWAESFGVGRSVRLGGNAARCAWI